MRINFTEIVNKFRNRFFYEASGGQITNTNIKDYVIKHVGVSKNSSEFKQSENSIEEVKAAAETDSYIKVSLDKTYQLIYKSGFKISSVNEKAQEYVEQRLSLMEFGTQIPFEILLQETAKDLVYYANAFWIKSRVDKIQGGLQAKPVMSKKPVGGYFRVDPAEVEIKRGKNGLVEKYKITGENELEIKAEDIIHFYSDREAGNDFGTPRIISALEDVKILRKIEGNSLALIYRYSSPLYQMKIGLPEPNFMATNQEIKDAQKQINNMPLDGIIVTNERTQFNAIGAEGNAIDLQNYLKYYENRVFTALNVSEAMMGRGGSKQDADSMEGLMHDTVKFYQNILSIFLEKHVFNEILLEGGFNPIMEKNDRVKFVFNEINLDTKLKMENHVLNQLQSNAITYEEARKELGRNAEGIDESRLYSNMITLQGQLQLQSAKESAALASGNGNMKNGKTQSQTPNGSVKNNDSPSNQHGTFSAKIKESIDFTEADKTSEHVREFHKKYANMYKLYRKWRNESIENGKTNKTAKNKTEKALSAEFDSIIEKKIREGFKNAKADFSDDAIFSRIKGIAHKQIRNLVEDIDTKMKSGNVSIEACFDFMEYRLRFACDYLPRKAYWSAYIIGCSKKDIKTLRLKLSDLHAKDHEETISTTKINLDEIPPFSPYCSCEIIGPKV